MKKFSALKIEIGNLGGVQAAFPRAQSSLAAVLIPALVWGGGYVGVGLLCGPACPLCDPSGELASMKA